MNERQLHLAVYLLFTCYMETGRKDILETIHDLIQQVAE